MKPFYVVLLVVVLCSLPIGAVSAAANQPFTNYTFAGPVFGMDAAPNGNLWVADAGAGIVELSRGSGAGTLVASLPGVSDVSAINKNAMFAVTGAPDRKLYLVSTDGTVQEIADLGAYEDSVNPDGIEPPDSNPYDVEALDANTALVADAGGNDLLIVDTAGNIDWIATLPLEVVSTANVKSLAGCPTPPIPDLAFACGLPDMMPTEPVATSVAIGPDGAYYVSELKGFPFPTGESRIWRIDPAARHAACGTSDQCSIVADGFTSIVDLAFGPNGTLFVTEIDEASAAAVELGVFFGLPDVLQGGTVNACDSRTWTCSAVVTEIPVPTAVAVHGMGNVYYTQSGLGPAQIIRLK